MLCSECLHFEGSHGNTMRREVGCMPRICALQHHLCNYCESVCVCVCVSVCVCMDAESRLMLSCGLRVPA